MLVRISKLVVVVALTFSLGAHWVFMQSVAWVGMVVSYSQTSPFAEAVTKTFDGQHPCGLCKIVQHGKEQEKKQDKRSSLTKVEHFLIEKHVMAFYPPDLQALVSMTFPSPLMRSDSPPNPPPEQA